MLLIFISCGTIYFLMYFLSLSEGIFPPLQANQKENLVVDEMS